MFGLSLPKLLALAAVIAAVWYGFRWLARYQQVQRSKAAKKVDRGGAAASTEELVRCPRCGTYVPQRSPVACGRADCPY